METEIQLEMQPETDPLQSEVADQSGWDLEKQRIYKIFNKVCSSHGHFDNSYWNFEITCFFPVRL